MKNIKFNFSFKKIFILFFLTVILPNFFLDLAQLKLGFHRSWINLDYFLPIFLLAFPNKILKNLGVLMFVIVAGIDYILVFMEYYPTLKLNDIPYLFKFIFVSDKVLIILFVTIIVFICFEAFLLYKTRNKTSLVEFVILLGLFVFFHLLLYLANPFDNSIIKNNVTETRFGYFFSNRNKTFLNLLNADQLKPTIYHNATAPWFNTIKNKQHLNNKLLLIVVESWGVANKRSAQQEVIKKLTDEKNLFDFFYQGDFQFLGLTAQGELRELCKLDTNSLDLSKIKTGFKNCLPQQLSKQGYKTYGIHGSTDKIYGRKQWYPLAGFQQTYFQENLNITSHCIPFNGICDWDIFPQLKKTLAENDKIFIHWMTLTTHFYYALSDIHNTRFNCKDQGIKTDDGCKNLRHQTQFFDNLAKLIKEPEFKGVEIIVVGDHVPPVFGFKDYVFKRSNPDSRLASVPWLHFKIKN